MKKLTEIEKEYFRHHLNLPQIGFEGQQKLKNSKVVVLGLGGLGSACANFLAMCGIGAIGLLDYDIVELSNISRQLLYNQSDIGKPKSECAIRFLKSKYPCSTFEERQTKLTESNIQEIITKYSLVIDATDNFETKFLINKYCYSNQIPFVFASVQGFTGHISTFQNSSPCLECLYEKPKMIKSNSFVFNLLPSFFGALQATEAVKILLGSGNLFGKVMIADLLDFSFTKIEFHRNKECRVCNA